MVTDGAAIRVAVLARPRDLMDSRYDAFITRHLATIDELARSADVSLILVGGKHDGDVETVIGRHRDKIKVLVRIPDPPAGRARRVAHAIVGVLTRRPWEKLLRASLIEINPDAVVTIGPWLQHEYRLAHSWPSVHLFEEDLMRMPDLAPQSRQARALRALIIRLGTMRSPTADIVVAISANEVEPAHRYFPRSHVVVVPLELADDWQRPISRSPGDYVLVVGNMSEERNSEGLVAVLDELRRVGSSLPVRIISGAGFADPLRQRVELAPSVEMVLGVDDLIPEYDSARLVLVPAQRATGMKATVLQGWARRRAVLTFVGSAVTLGNEHRAGVLEGRTAFELATSIGRLWNDAEGREHLAAKGHDTFKTHFATRPGRRIANSVFSLSEKRHGG